MKKKLSIIYILIIFVSCNKPNQNSFEIANTIYFNTGYIDPPYYCIGSIIGEEDIIYFSDRDLSIQFFDNNGIKIDSVNFPNEAFLFCNSYSLRAVCPITKDSIFLVNNNKVAVINQKGLLIGSFDIEDFMTNIQKNKYGYEVSLLPFLAEDSKKIFFSIIDMSEDKLNEFFQNKISYNQYLLYFYENLYNSKFILRIEDLFSDKPKLDFLIDNYYKSFEKYEMNMVVDKLFYVILNNTFYSIALSKGIIYAYDIDSFDLIRTIKIDSKYTSNGFLPEKVTADDADFDKKFEIETEKECLAGLIMKMFFINGQYYIIVSHELNSIQDWDRFHEGDYRPFSVIIYDENFENQKEYMFEADTYAFRNSFVTKEGLWIQRKPENLNRENYGTQTFDLFKFN